MKRNILTKQQILQLLYKYYKTHGVVPKITQTAEDIGVSPTVVRKQFGTWNRALQLAGIKYKPRTRISTKCALCNKEISIRLSAKRTRNFCSQSHAAIFKNKNNKFSNKTKRKIANSLKQYYKYNPAKRAKRAKQLTCVWCKLPFEWPFKKKTCSSKCCHEYMSNRASLWLKTHRSHVRGPHQQSYLEQSFEKWLNKNGIKRGISGYLTEVYFFNKETKKNGWIDFCFPRKRLIIELDGTHHIKRKHLDEIRDLYLKQRGWKVIRITHREYIKKERTQEVKSVLKIE